MNLISASKYLTGDYHRYKASSFSVVHTDGTKTQLKLPQRKFQLDVMKIFHHKGSPTLESYLKKLWKFLPWLHLKLDWTTLNNLI